MTEPCQLGLLYLVKLLIDADGVADEKELEALRIIKERENIPETTFAAFEKGIEGMSEREIYQKGIELMNNCCEADKLYTFATLFRLSEVDGRVHLKEIKLLLYSIKTAGLEFEAVVNYARNTEAIF